MSNGLSLYLDLVRFLMAFEVMLGHSTFHAYMGKGFLWQVDPFRHMQTAVIGFFVLSGFVIAFVSKTKESNLTDYTCSRIARMHSVIVPALLVTLLFDWIGTSINPGFYKTWDFPTPIGDNQVWSYFLSFFYLNNVWFIPEVVPGTNGPFWTMTYEVMFYAMFGAMWYLKGVPRYIVTVFLMVLAGKAILILFPVWLMGFATYHLCSRYPLSKKWALPGFILSLVALVACSTMRQGFQWAFTGRATHLDYAAGILIAINIYAAAGIAPMLGAALGRFDNAVRWLGMLTFSLYLCHRPLLNFFSVVAADAPTSLIQKAWVFGGTFAVVIAVAYVGEWLRIRIKGRLAVLFKFKGRELAAMV
jgi:peptidoglycan/LPS O-acetylase OafA/YrhL